MIFAPVLTEVAVALTGSDASFEREPAKWAYALRDAVGLARPDWIVTHHDLDLEALAATTFGDVLRRTDAAALFITDGAIAGSCDPAVLRSAGERGATVPDHV